MAKTKKAKVVEEEILEDDDLELEELDDDDVEEEDEAPKTKKKSKAAARRDEVKFGASDLAALLTETTGTPINARGLRVLLRKMARDGRLVREVTADNRTRYSWTGPSDPEVKAIIKAVKSGEIEEGKKEALAKLKESKGAQKATKKTKKAKKVEEVEEDDDEDFDDED